MRDPIEILQDMDEVAERIREAERIANYIDNDSDLADLERQENDLLQEARECEAANPAAWSEAEDYLDGEE